MSFASATTITTAWTTISSTIAPTGVPWRFDTDAITAGSRRSRAIAKTPRVDATAAPTYGEHVEEHHQHEDLEPELGTSELVPGAPSANRGARRRRDS